MPQGENPSKFNYDLIVIGGGVNGTGIAWDAALRGLSVLLLEKDDLGSGTSAYSSRLIHGGLRYLENFEFDLVAESLREREWLLRHAPHLVRPLPLAIPAYRKARHPVWLIRMGMLLYDILSWGKSLPSHRYFNRQDFLRRFPFIDQRELTGGPVYYDAQIDFPERLCLENAMAALETGRATIRTHTRVTGFLWDGKRLMGVRLTDELTGETQQALSKVIVNASGPWVDHVASLAVSQESGTSSENPDSDPRRRIGGTKGSHIVVRRFEQGPDIGLYVEARSDGRPFFILPWLSDYYLIGTTDERFEGNPDDASVSPSEIDYLLKETNAVLPNANLTAADVLYAYAGIRPLPFTQDQSAGKITRRHWVDDHAFDPARPIPGLVSIIGGKLTTYRNLAEESVDYIVKAYHLTLPEGSPIPASPTWNCYLPGGRGIDSLSDYKKEQCALWRGRTDLSEAVLLKLIDWYGSRYSQLIDLAEGNTFLKEPLCEGSWPIGAQVVYAVQTEMARTVSDLMLRRLGLGLMADRGVDAAEAVALIMARELGWDESRRQAEIQHYQKSLDKHYPSVTAISLT